MKTLAIAFSIAISIIGAAIVLDSTSCSKSGETCKTGKTIVTRDTKGRTIEELSLVTNGKAWEEVSKKEVAYVGNIAETTSYDKVNGEWVPANKSVVEYAYNGSVENQSYYKMGEDGRWTKMAEQSMNDLSVDNGMVEDMVFDADGNLVMLATYNWVDGGKDGLSKEEYEYSGGERRKVVSYEWDGEQWNLETANNVIIKK